MSYRRQSFFFILSLPLLLSKNPHHARESVGRQKSFSIIGGADDPAPANLSPCEDIGSVLEGGVKVCQRQLVNEVLVPEFAHNLGRKGATPIQRGFNSIMAPIGARAASMTCAATAAAAALAR
jgi:hypothetical protein